MFTPVKFEFPDVTGNPADDLERLKTALRNYLERLESPGNISLAEETFDAGDSAPTPTAETGALTSASATVRWQRMGRLVFYQISATITTNGTGAGSVRVDLPFTALFASVGSGRETVVGGKALTATVNASSATVAIRNYDNTYPGADTAVLIVQGSIEVA